MNLQSEIEELFNDYKLHHKDVDVCFHDHVAAAHIAHSIIQSFRKRVPEKKPKITDHNDYGAGFNDGINQTVDDFIKELE